MERLKKVGTVRAYNSSEIKTSRVGVGFEKLDRNAFDPEKSYDKVAALGVKWARIQSGWERTEQVKGVYDFSWLDTIVDNLLERNLIPWMNVSYGNPLYTEKAKEVFGSVGCPPVATEAEFTAWGNYVRALVAHFAGRVEYFEIWNEPDGKSCWKIEHSGKTYGRLVQLSAKVAREVNPDAKIIAGVQNKPNFAWAADFFSSGAGSDIDCYSFHGYGVDEFKHSGFIKALRALGCKYNPALEIIQGEGGTQSRSGGKGALKFGAWTKHRQAKYMLRRFMVDFQMDVKFSSWFSSIDMMEALNGVRGQLSTWLDYGYFGVLQADFDENGCATGDYSEKPSYRTLQVIASVFREEFTIADLPVTPVTLPSPRLYHDDEKERDICMTSFCKPNGSMALAYWKSTDILTTDYYGTASFVSAAAGEIRLIDLMDGTVYEIPEDMIEVNGEGGSVTLKNLPLLDYPLLITFGSFL